MAENQLKGPRQEYMFLKGTVPYSVTLAGVRKRSSLVAVV